MPFIFYSQSAGMVNFLLENFGRKRFVSFCRRVRDKADWKKSLLSVYKFSDLEEFEESWLDYLSKDIVTKGVE